MISDVPTSLLTATRDEPLKVGTRYAPGVRRLERLLAIALFLDTRRRAPA